MENRQMDLSEEALIPLNFIEEHNLNLTLKSHFLVVYKSFLFGNFAIKQNISIFCQNTFDFILKRLLKVLE